MKLKRGLIAILDALGAASYTDEEIARFLEARRKVLDLLQRTASIREIKGSMDASQFETFTFADTLLISYTTQSEPSLDDVKNFSLILRKLIVESLAKGILFRGAISVGTFYVEGDSNTVMGQAVTDAAAWYEAADWIGIHATPHASYVFQQLVEETGDSLGHVLVDYAVPMNGRPGVTLKAINWPKFFVVPSLAPKAGPKNPRSKCLWLLTRHRFPRGTESKYFNAMAFFDHCVAAWQSAKKQQAG